MRAEGASREGVRWSLRTKTLVATSLIGLAIPAAGGLWTIFHVRDALQDRAEAGQLATAKSAAGQIKQAFDFAIPFGVAIAHRPGFVEWTRTADAPNLIRVMQNAYTTTPLFASIASFDLRGRLIAQYPAAPPVPRPDLAVAPAIYPAVQTAGDAVLRIREPIADPGGAPVGILTAEISFAKTAGGVALLRFGRTGAATLVDREGRVLVTGEPRRSGSMIGSEALLDLVSRHREGTLRYFSEVLDRREIAAAVPVAGRPWVVFVAQSESEAFAPVRTLAGALTIGLLAFLALAAAIGVGVAASFGRYERQLTAAAARLDATNAELASANQAIRDFVATASHELRSPLNVVTGFAALLRDQADTLTPEERREYAGLIDRQAWHLTRMVDDMLTLSRIEAGALDVRRKRLAIRGAIEQVMRDLGVDGVTASCPDLEAEADPDHVHRILTNYLNNAVKYGAAPIEIEARSAPEGIEIRVRDRGPGVPEGFVPRLFERFARAEKSSPTKGTGLGLSIVRGMARANGGDAWYERNEPTGSVFVVRLPPAS